MSLADVIAAITASRAEATANASRAEANAEAREAHMFAHVAASMGEVLGIVHQDIEHGNAEIRGEVADLAVNLREADVKYANAHRESEAALEAAARAEALVDDMKFELKEN